MSNSTVSSDEIRTLFQKVPQLVSQLLRLLSEKERYVIEQRFNLSHSRRQTLEEIGKNFDVTRERIRQIEKSALQKLKRNVFTTALPSMFIFAKEFLKQHGGLLREDRFFNALVEQMNLGGNFDKESVRLALKLDPTFILVGNTIEFYPYIALAEIDEDLIKKVCFSGEKILEEHSDVMDREAFISKLHKKIQNQCKLVQYNPQKIVNGFI